VFCADLFSHRLLALDDEEFLATYSDWRSVGGGEGRSKIRTEDVVVAMRDILYDLYWSRPVTAEDIIVPSSTLGERVDGKVTLVEEELNCQRGRLLLSGTKLRNTLYERCAGRKR